MHISTNAPPRTWREPRGELASWNCGEFANCSSFDGFHALHSTWHFIEQNISLNFSSICYNLSLFTAPDDKNNRSARCATLWVVRVTIQYRVMDGEKVRKTLFSLRQKSFPNPNSTTEPGIKACMWLGEISSCSCLTVLPCPTWLLLNKICIPFSRSLYIEFSRAEEAHF